MSPSVRFSAPDQSLRPFITAYYIVDLPKSPGPMVDLLHPEWPNIRFNLGGDWSTDVGGEHHTTLATLYGPSSRTGTIRCATPGRGQGVGLLPLGWAHLIGRPAADYADRGVDLAEVFGDQASALRDGLLAAEDDAGRTAVLDAFFLRLHQERPPPPALMVRAHQVLLDPEVTTAEGFAAALGVSARHAARLSLQMFGFAPKLLLQRQRFLRTLQRIRANLDQPWADQLDDAYFDQSHFVRDFQRFMGMSPRAYFTSPHVLLAAAGQARARALGQSLQGLHPPERPGAAQSTKSAASGGVAPST